MPPDLRDRGQARGAAPISIPPWSDLPDLFRTAFGKSHPRTWRATALVGLALLLAYGLARWVLLSALVWTWTAALALGALHVLKNEGYGDLAAQTLRAMESIPHVPAALAAVAFPWLLQRRDARRRQNHREGS